MTPDAPQPFPFDNSYVRLPARFFARLDPDPAPAPRLLALNAPLARLLGADPDALAGPAGAAWLSGAAVPPGAAPLAMVYAGHQFGGWSPRLGDGRALLLGEVVGTDGLRRDVQLKGSGPTPFSRNGDGRAALGPVLREYLVAEAMHALGVPTTRALAAVATGATVWREGPEPGAVLTRVARAHVRVGTFQYFASQDDEDALRHLSDHCRARLYPQARDAADLLRAVVAAQAALVAQWMALGFIHGVMNTDNMAISGETIDYGPCAFMDAYDPAQVYSAIDRGGRYAFGNQPRIAHWNLAQLAQALLPVLDPDPARALAVAQAAVDAFPALYGAAWLDRMRAKLGLTTAHPDDRALAADLLEAMAAARADFTLTFRRLGDAAAGDAAGFLALFAASDGAPEAADPEALRPEAPRAGDTRSGADPASALQPGAPRAGDTRSEAAHAGDPGSGTDRAGGPGTGATDPAAPADASADAWLARWRARLAQEPEAPDARAAAMAAVNPAFIPRNHRVAQALAAAQAGDLGPFHRLGAVLARPYAAQPDAADLAAPPAPGEEIAATFCGT